MNKIEITLLILFVAVSPWMVMGLIKYLEFVYNFCGGN